MAGCRVVVQLMLIGQVNLTSIVVQGQVLAWASLLERRDVVWGIIYQPLYKSTHHAFPQ